MRLRNLALLLVLFCLLPLISRAQVSPGTPPFQSFGAGSGPDVINLQSLNIHFAIPVRHKAGRGLNFNYDLTYDSSVWYPVISGGTTSWQVSPYTGLVLQGKLEGVAAAAGQLTYQTSNTGGNCGQYGQYQWQQTTYNNFVFTDLLGSHTMNGTVYYISSPGGSGCPSPGWNPASPVQMGTAADGSGITLFAGGSTNGWYIRYPNGQNRWQDRNGNYISYSGSTFTDTLNTTPLTVPAPNPPNEWDLTYQAPSGGTAYYRVKYGTYTVRTNFGCSGIHEFGPTTEYLVSEIDLPDGSKYTFTYEGTPGYSGDYTGRIASVTLPTGGTITYAYTGGSNGIECTDGSTAGLQRATPDTGSNHWTYSRALGSGAASTTTVTDPQGNQTAIDFVGAYETERDVYSGSVGGTLLRKTYTCYNGASAPCNSTSISLPISTLTATTVLSGTNSLQSKTVTSYNNYGLITEVDEYGYGNGSPASLMRKTLTSYASLGNGIADMPVSVTVCSPGGTASACNSSGTVVAQTTYSYDQSGVTSSSSPQLLPVSGSRGNATTISYFVGPSSNPLTKTYTYYDNGNVNVATDVNGAQYIFAYTTCGNSFLTKITEPVGSMTQQMTWDCNGGVLLTATDENSTTVTTHYTNAYFWRPDSVQDQLSNTMNLTYTGQTAVESSLVFNSNSSTADILATLDSLGRAYLSQKKQSPSGSYDSVQASYDTLGRPTKVTLPYSAGGGATCSGTCPGKITTYDALGRPISVTDAGGLNITYQYNANDVYETVGPTPSGETNPKRKQYEYDALGRLTSVCEITSVSGSGSCPQTNGQTGYYTQYTYDVLNDLTGVTGGTQTRYYTYDGLGRMTSETNPESGATSYYYDSDSSMCGNGAYTSKGDLVKTTDQAGKCVMRYYDQLHRLTDVGNNSQSVSHCKRFRYDNSSGYPGSTKPSGTANTVGRLIEAATDQCISGNDAIITDEWFSYDARGETTDMWQSTPLSGGYYHANEIYWQNGAPKQLSGIVSLPSFSYGVDGEGRVNTVSASAGQNPVTATSYNAASQVTSVTFGSGDTDSFTYDSNTDRMTQYKFSINGQSLIGALTWNANGSLGRQNITDPFNTNDTQNCSYLHDDLGRVGANNTSTPGLNCVNGSTTVWSQIFSYDAFGNLSKNGTQSFQPTYNSATNQMTSIGGQTPSYDADGNVTNDFLNTYSWDAYGRPIMVDGASVTYDAFGRLVDVNYPWEVFYTPAGDRIQFVGQLAHAAIMNLPGGARAQYNGSGLQYYEHRDYEGNGRLLSTPSRTFYSSTAYGAFGELYVQSAFGAGDFTGIGQIFSNSIYDFPAREYGTQGRWPSPDPAGLAAVNPMDPQTWNRYAYARNSALELVDPLGLQSGSSPSPVGVAQCWTPGFFGGGNGDPGDWWGGNCMQCTNGVWRSLAVPGSAISICSGFSDVYLPDIGDQIGSHAGGASGTGTAQGPTAPPPNICTGTGRGLGNTGALAGNPGGIPGVDVELGTAAVIPSQFGVQNGAALVPYAADISGIIGAAPFSAVTDVIGGASPIPGMNVRTALQQIYPGQLIIEIYGAADQGNKVPVSILVPGGLGCPTGTTPAVMADPVLSPVQSALRPRGW